MVFEAYFPIYTGFPLLSLPSLRRKNGTQVTTIDKNQLLVLEKLDIMHRFLLFGEHGEDLHLYIN